MASDQAGSPTCQEHRRPWAWPVREFVNAMFRVLRGGIAWRLLPSDFPLWSTVYPWFAAWRDGGVFEDRTPIDPSQFVSIAGIVLRAVVCIRLPFSEGAMPLFAFDGLTTDQVVEFAELANAAYAGEDAPTGWTTLVGSDIGFQPGPLAGSFQGNYFIGGIESAFLAAARIMRQGNTLALSFRGTDSIADFALYPEILDNNTYIDNFSALLETLADYISASGIEDVWIVGHSLGAAAVNILRNVAGERYSGAFAEATYVSVAAPTISTDNDILNIGFENDWVFKAIPRVVGVEFHPDFPSTTDRIILYNDEYASPDWALQGILFATVPDEASVSAHHIAGYIDAIERIGASTFYQEMDRDSVVVVVDTDQPVTDKRSPTSDHFGSPAFYVGRPVADIILGGTAGDWIDGAAGNDSLTGGPGDDQIDGGEGTDTAFYSSASNEYDIYCNFDGDIVISQFGGDRSDGTDTLTNVEFASFTDMVFDLAACIRPPDIVGSSQPDRLVGTRFGERLFAGGGDDTVIGRAGRDLAAGGDGDDHLFGGPGNDTLAGNAGADLVSGGDGDDHVFGGDGNDTVAGNAGADLVQGGDGDDRVFGGAGNDTLAGNAGADRLFGGDGDDRIFGGPGNDILIGQRGDDLLKGGLGDDIFAIGLNQGVDTVIDFGPTDLIGLRGNLSFSNLLLFQFDTDTAILSDLQVLAILKDTAASNLSAADFVAA